MTVEITVDSYTVGGDGTVTLAVVVPGPLDDDTRAALGAGGATVDVGDDQAVTVTYTWSALMVPTDPRGAVRVFVEATLAAAPPVGGTLADPGELL